MRGSDGIAIIGVSCRFPSAPNLDALWALLRSGQDAVRDTYDDRRLGIAQVREASWMDRIRGLRAGLLPDVDAFDAEAFDISAREACLIDPQQRLLLEVAWEALDDAGQSLRGVDLAKVGAYVGIYGRDYLSHLNHRFPDVDVRLANGGSAFALAGRLSYAFGFRGPSFTVDSACSSSLVAVHEACQALVAGECDLALAGGANLILDPVNTVAYLNTGALSPDSRCKFGDASANGFVRSEGVAMVVLKRLDQALRDGDPVHAVIRSSTVAHCGQTGSSLVAPGEAAQVELFEETLSRARLTSDGLDYIEAHGTGTRVGDRSELGALHKVLSARARERSEPCLVGSIKTNIGHTEGAAGIAGLLKAMLSLKHGEVPPSLHFSDPNPDIEWNDDLFTIPTTLKTIRPQGRRAVAAVSSYGITGTLACVILEAPEALVSAEAEAAPGLEHAVHQANSAPLILPLSARNPEALRRYASAFATRLRQDLTSVSDIAYSAALRCRHHDVRLACVGRDGPALVEALESFVEGEPVPELFVAPATVVEPPKIGWIFSGQGSHWAGMGMVLYDQEPAFRDMLDELDALIFAEAGFSVIEALRARGAASKLDHTEIAQPAIFALQLGLSRLLASWGLDPAVIVGHSVGEVAAAFVAGMMSLDDAVRIICARGRVAAKAVGLGKMAAFEMNADEAQALVAESSGALDLAAINSPRSVTLSGRAEPLARACEQANARGLFARMLDVDYPSHGALLDPFIPEMAAATAEIALARPAIPFVSTVLGRFVVGTEMGRDYWAKNLRQTVLFAPAIEALADAGCDIFVEIGPHPALLYSVKQVLQGRHASFTAIETLRRDTSDAEAIKKTVAGHYVAGCDPTWSRLVPAGGAASRLPPYPWVRERYWVDHPDRSRISEAGAVVVQSTSSGLLQSRLALLRSDGPAYWQCDLSHADFPWLGNHRVRDRATVPAAAYLSAALQAADMLVDGGGLSDVELHEALILPEDGTVRLQYSFVPDGAPGHYSLSIEAADPARAGDARIHVTGRVLPQTAALPMPRQSLDLKGVSHSHSAVYAAMSRSQLRYSGEFAAIRSIVTTRAKAVARLCVSPQERVSAGLHPQTIDACLQALLALTPHWGNSGDLWLPRSIKTVRINNDRPINAEMFAVAVGIPSLNGEDFTGDVSLVDQRGDVLIALEGVRLHRLAARQDSSGIFHQISWEPKPLNISAPLTATQLASIETVIRAQGASASERERIMSTMSAADELAALSVAQAFAALGLDFAPGRMFGLDDVIAEAGIAPAHQRLLPGFLAMLCDEGVLARDAERWRVVKRPLLDSLDGRLDAELAAASVDTSAFWELFSRASRNLAEVLAGRVAAVDLLFGDEGARLLKDLYAKHLFWQPPLRQLAASIPLFIDTFPADQPARVLEVGAGTGGLTAHILEALKERCEHYVFTDRTPYFLERARRRFAAYPFLADQLLDIEQSPQDQDFEPAQFDIVSAGNILHATVNLRQSLAHAAQLLKPGGFLLLQEEGVRERWTDLIFGLTDGWWRFEDRDLRPDHPLIARAAWQEILEAAGFDNVMIFGGQPNDPCGAIAIVAQKRLAQLPLRPWLLLADRGGVADSLARLLCDHGIASSVVPNQLEHPDVLRAYLAECDAPGQVIIDLQLLDARLGGQDSAEMLDEIERSSVAGLLGVLHPLLDCNRQHPPRLVVVTAAAQADNEGRAPELAQASAWAVVRNARLENPGADLCMVDLDRDPNRDGLRALAVELIHGDGEPEIMLRRDQRFARRLSLAAEAEGSPDLPASGPFALEIERRGLLDGFHAAAIIPAPPEANEVQIRVEAAGINFRDVLNLLGAVDRVPLGLECSGIVTAVGPDVTDIKIGDAVIAAGFGSWRSMFNTVSELVAPKPAGLSHEAAAGLPIAYLTAAYVLRHLARVQPGQSVLIHSIAGGVGLAALHVAKAAGAEVLGTAGSPVKRDFAKSLGAYEVLDSRSLQFADDIRASTRPQVNVVINSFAGEFIPASLDLLAEGGTFIEIGKRDIWTHAQVHARRPDVAYHVVELADVMRLAPGKLADLFRDIASEIDAGGLPPLPIRSFPIAQALPALRFMQDARHTGKIVLNLPDRQEVDKAAQSRANGAILITGGLGGLGLATAQWLVEQGYRNLILVGRNAPGPATLSLLETLRSQGATIWSERCNVGVHAEIAALIARCGADLPPLRGVFHLAGVLDDAPVHELSVDRFLSVYRPKMFGAWSLHLLTSHLDLDHFVLFSSWTALLGSPGQANHASANSFLDALAHYRRAKGLPAQSINWGGWRDVGAAVDPVRISHLANQGLLAMTAEAAVQALGDVIASGAIQVGVSPFDPAAWRRAAGSAAGNTVAAGPAKTALDVAQPDEAHDHEDLNTAGGDTLHDELQSLAAGQTRRNFLEGRIKERLSQVLRTPPKAFDVRKPFKSLGLDSLTALELRNMMESETLVKLPASLIFNHNTISKLATELAARMRVGLDTDLGGEVPHPSANDSAPSDPNVPRAGQTPPLSDNGTLRTILSELPAGLQRRNFIEGQIKDRLSQVLRTPAKAFDVRKPFKNLGVDSLTALELRNILEIDTRLKLPASFIFNHNNITKLATELATQMGVPLDSDPAAAPRASAAAKDEDVDALLDALQGLPEEEVLKLLSGKGA